MLALAARLAPFQCKTDPIPVQIVYGAQPAGIKPQLALQTALHVLQDHFHKDQGLPKACNVPCADMGAFQAYWACQHAACAKVVHTRKYWEQLGAWGATRVNFRQGTEWLAALFAWLESMQVW